MIAKEDSVIKDRSKYVGGSDLPIIMGISPFKTRYDLLLEKAGLKENNFEGNCYTDFGDKLEPKIRDYINETLYSKNPFAPDCKIVGNFRGNCDGVNNIAILEIKTTSQIKEKVNDYKTYLVQLLKYMEVFEKEVGVLAVYARPEDFNEEFDSKRLQIMIINKDSYTNLLEDINTAIKNFLIDLEKIKENPFATEQDLIPNDIMTTVNKILKLEKDFIEAKAKVKEYEEEQKKLKNQMEQFGIKKWETPNHIKFTVVDGTPDSEVQVFDEEKFKEENKELYIKYLINKIKKGRKSSLRITFPKNKDE